MSKKYILIVLTGSFLAACTVGKKYERKPLDMPEAFRETISVTADSVQLPWKTFFQDPLLTQLIEKALVKNNEVAVAILSMRQLDLNYKQARLQMLPTVDFSLAANRSWLSKNSLNGSLSEQFIGTPYMDDYNAGFNVAWEADIWRKVKMQKEDALSQYFMQKENLSALQTRIIAQVAQAYYQLIALDEQLEIAERNVQLSDSTLQMVILQYNSAQVSSVAVGQAEAQKKTAELLIPLAKQNIAIQENALSILCGDYPSAIERSGSLDDALVGDVFATGVPANLLSRRPDVKAAEYAVMSNNAKTGLAKANMYPALSISASSAANSFNFTNWFSIPGSIVKNLGVNVAQPVFRRNALKTAYETAKLEQEKTVKQFQQSVLVAVGEVSDALAIIKHSDERLVLVADRKTSLDNATKDALLLFNNAMASYLEVISAQNNALQNELEVISIKKEKRDAITNLYRAVGGGVE